MKSISSSKAWRVQNHFTLISKWRSVAGQHLKTFITRCQGNKDVEMSSEELYCEKSNVHWNTIWRTLIYNIENTWLQHNWVYSSCVNDWISCILCLLTNVQTARYVNSYAEKRYVFLSKRKRNGFVVEMRQQGLHIPLQSCNREYL